MTGEKLSVVDNTKYVYGCTIEGKDTLQRDVGYLWKSVTPGVKESVRLTFLVTAEEASAETPQYWLWNMSNIVDNRAFNLELSNIKIEKSAPVVAPYVDFLNTNFIFAETENYKETVGKSSFRTTASYDELNVKVETISGCEHMYVPIKGLTVGNTYTIKFDELTTGVGIGNNSAYDYGAWVADNISNIQAKNILFQNKIHVTQSQFPHYCITSVNEWHTNNEFSFTATATQMYWIWEYAAFTDSMWGNIHLRNVSIVNSTNNFVNTLNLIEDKDNSLSNVVKENEIIKNNIDKNLNTVTNEIKNTISNTITNVVSNTTNNQVNNNVSNMIENKVVNKIENKVENSVSKDIEIENKVNEDIKINLLENKIF